ncbi:MAG: TIGR00341 family protein [Desulfobacteraceae bacterium]|jgi:uncharacterized hydrophobic protein (TIGR00341 family)
MALRLLEIVLPRDRGAETERLLETISVEYFWSDENSSGDKVLWKVLVEAEKAEVVLDAMEKAFAEDFRVLLLPVEASLPRAPEPPSPEAPESPTPGPSRMCREELYADVVDLAKLSGVFLVLVFLSSLVAAAGILRNNVAVVLGAMVIAPLLGPNMALSFATTLGDAALARKALKTAFAGIAVSLLISIVLGAVMTIDPQAPEIASRTQVSLGDVMLALASGIAGALAFTTGFPAALIGVMISLALLPPLVTFGMLLASGYLHSAANALLLFLTNVICVNLAGVGTFLVQGIRPLTWWEAAKAKKATRNAIAIWLFLLAALVLMIMKSK